MSDVAQYAALVSRIWGRRYLEADDGEAWSLALNGTDRRFWGPAADAFMAETPERMPSPAQFRVRILQLQRQAASRNAPVVAEFDGAIRNHPGPPDRPASDPYQQLAGRWTSEDLARGGGGEKMTPRHVALQRLGTLEKLMAQKMDVRPTTRKG